MDRYKHLFRDDLLTIKADIAKQRDAMRTADAGSWWTNVYAPAAFSGVRRWLRDQEDEVDQAIARIDHTIRPLTDADIDVFVLADVRIG